jgi:hypothetical protein
MDPLTILSLVETCAGLSVTAGKLAIGLKTLACNYQSASLTFRSLSSQCRLFACAVRAIQSWMDEAPDHGRLDDSIWEQLADSLEVANDAIYALETELTSTSGGTVNSFWQKMNVIWNMPNLKALEDCIHKQVSGLSVILQIMSLPTFQGQKDSLESQRAVFDDSRSSAMSVVDPASSTIREGDLASKVGARTITTRMSQMPAFDFDEMLMASQVYLRNRNKTMALHASNTRGAKTRDMGVSVDAWDLLLASKHELTVPDGLDEGGLQLWVASILLPHLQVLRMCIAPFKPAALLTHRHRN